MEEKAKQLLDLLIQGIETGSELAKQQAEPLLDEYWRYLLADKILGIISGLLFLVLAYICYRVARYSWKQYKIVHETNSWDDSWLWGVIPPVVLACFFIPFGSTVVICNSSSLVKLIVAPKIYVIKSIAGDIK